jgi:hypothetical protein
MTYIDELPIETQVQELDKLFRQVFSTQEGRIVLAEILKNLFYFDIPENKDNEVLRNYATLLVRRIMSHDEDALVNALLSVKKE